MQTFLPLTMPESPRVLDLKRLNKQILEGRQIMSCLRKKEQGTAKGWANHPAVLMWEGYTWALLRYVVHMHKEYEERRNRKHRAFVKLMEQDGKWALRGNLGTYPRWLGYESLHSSHRSRLLHKGTLDVLRNYFPKPHWDEIEFGKKLNRFTVDDVRKAAWILHLSYESQLFLPSHYAQFNWVETPGDDYIWPKDIVYASI